MELLKQLSEITKPDARQHGWVLLDRRTGEYRSPTLEDHHAAIECITLGPEVPALLSDEFETARNLLLYAWFVYPFIVVAELHVLSTLEFALRARAEREKAGVCNLQALMNLAVARDWIRDAGVKEYRRAQFGQLDFLESVGNEDRVQAAESDPHGFVKILAEFFPKIRNELAHGTAMLWPGGYTILNLVAKLLGQLCTPITGTGTVPNGLLQPPFSQ